jgi:hypothetical protein
VLLLSRETGQEVLGPDGRVIGRLADLSVGLGEQAGPHRVERLLVKRHNAPDLLMPWAAIGSFQHTGVVARSTDDPAIFTITSTTDALADDEILLRRDVLDTQIVDIVGQRLARVADVVLTPTADNRLELVGVEVGFGGVLRRLGLRGLAARMGVVTGQGLIGLVRQRYGVRFGGAALAALVVANIGTTCAEFAGIAAGSELFGISRYASVPAAAVIVSLLVLRGSFHRVEHFLLLLSTVFLAYIASGVLAHPDWGAAVHGMLVPTMPGNSQAIAIVTATVGTTLAPWGLSFIQSYAVDKKLRTEDLALERIDVITGAVLTGVIGFFVVVACAATLHRQDHSIRDAADTAVALKPLAGAAAAQLFAVGLIGAAFPAASILPLSTPTRCASTPASKPPWTTRTPRPGPST